MFAGSIHPPVPRALSEDDVPKGFSLENWGNDDTTDGKGEARERPSLGST